MVREKQASNPRELMVSTEGEIVCSVQTENMQKYNKKKLERIKALSRVHIPLCFCSCRFFFSPSRSVQGPSLVLKKNAKSGSEFFFWVSQGFPQDLGFWPPRGTSQKKVEFFFFFQ